MVHLIPRPMVIASLAVLMVVPSLVQAQGQRNNPRQIQQRIQEQMKAAAANQPELPRDPQLLDLHKDFIAKAEKLAGEYERKKQYAQAREVYESLVRLVPKYGAAEAGLKRVLSNQSQQDTKVAKVESTGLWQDSGATLAEGMPVHVEIKGTWKVVNEVGPEGIEIPEEMRPRDSRIKLGSLIGVIAKSPNELQEGKPFPIRNGDEFMAPKSGRLFLRMFDVDPTDNEGEIFIQIKSTFFN